MRLRTKTKRSRQGPERTFGKREVRLVRRYARLRPLEKPSAYQRLRKLLGRILRALRLRPPALPPEPWLPGLKHVDNSDEAKPVVIWALGMDRETLRTACGGFEKLQASAPGYIPVLVTDVADFAFFSRLGWLVEYVPSLSAPAGGYGERKLRYLAWRYRDAVVLPATAGLGDAATIEGLLIG